MRTVLPFLLTVIKETLLSFHYCLFRCDCCSSDLFHPKIKGNMVNTKNKQTREMIPKELQDKSLQSDIHSVLADIVSSRGADVLD